MSKSNFVEELKGHQKLVGEFHEAFGHIVEHKPKAIPKEVAVPRAVWTAEEVVEFLYATSAGDMDEFKKFVNELKKGIDKTVQKIEDKADPVEDVLVGQMDAIVDTLYFAYGTAVVAGTDISPVFQIVQDANMGKLWEDGKPRYRQEDGKIQKPPHWEEKFAPEKRIKEEIHRQKTEA